MLPMKQEELSLEQVAPFFFNTIESGDVEIFKQYLHAYPALINKKINGSTPFSRVYKKKEAEFISHLLQKECCTNTSHDNIFKNSMFAYIENPEFHCFFAKALLSSNGLCSSNCKHNSDKDQKEQPKDINLLDQTLDNMMNSQRWNKVVPFVLMASDSKTQFLERLVKAKQIKNPDYFGSNFEHAIILGIDKVCVDERDFKYFFACPAFTQDMQKYLANQSLEKLKKLLSKDNFECALVSRNELGLWALLQRLPLLSDDTDMKIILENFHVALEEHTKIWPPFVEEIKHIQAIEYKRQMSTKRTHEFFMKCNKLQNVHYRFR